MLEDTYSENVHAIIKHKPYVTKLDLFLIQVKLFSLFIFIEVLDDGPCD
jgi:hypothetical protein